MSLIRQLRPFGQPFRSLLQLRLSTFSTVPRCLIIRSSFRTATEWAPKRKLQLPQSPHYLRSYSTKQKSDRLPPVGHTVFGLFPRTFPDGPPPKGRFKLDTSVLESELKDLLSKSTPSKPTELTGATAEEPPTLSNSDPDLLNLSYTLLSDPIKRATYILHLRGIEVKDDAAEVEDEEFKMAMKGPIGPEGQEVEDVVDEAEEKLLGEMYELDDMVDGVSNTEDALRLINENMQALERVEYELDELFKEDKLEEIERVVRLARHREKVVGDLMTMSGKYGKK